MLRAEYGGTRRTADGCARKRTRELMNISKEALLSLLLLLRMMMMMLLRVAGASRLHQRTRRP